MRIPHITIGAALMAVIVIGCSKNSSPVSQAVAPTNAAAMSTSTTNVVASLQAKYQENEQQILEIQSNMDILRKTYQTNDQPYLDEQAKLDQKLSLRKMITTEIQAMKH